MALLHHQPEHAEADEADKIVVTAAVAEITIERNAIARTINVTPMM